MSINHDDTSGLTVSKISGSNNHKLNFICGEFKPINLKFVTQMIRSYEASAVSIWEVIWHDWCHFCVYIPFFSRSTRKSLQFLNQKSCFLLPSSTVWETTASRGLFLSRLNESQLKYTMCDVLKNISMFNLRFLKQRQLLSECLPRNISTLSTRSCFSHVDES